jgi:iron complex outermembrane recepter protein
MTGVFGLRTRVALSSVAVVIFYAGTATAQQSAPASNSGGNSALPPVVVEAPKPRRAARSEAPARSQRSAARTAATPRKPPTPRNTPNVQRADDPRGPIHGYVAGNSMSGTKTNTPLMETPQSISVIGSAEIRDQKPEKLDQALRYAPGVRAEIFGVDPRNDWFQIRGFPAQTVGLFQDGLQVYDAFAFATHKFEPFGIERIDILRGPSAVLYGGSAPGGIVNVISKLPSATPVNTLEAGADSYGNGYLSFDLQNASRLDAGQQLYTRLLGTVKGGGTQVDFTEDDSYFIAPSVTYKPDADTTLTVLASASKDRTNNPGFLPYVGTVTAAPFGKIPTNLFASDPSVDTFNREQEAIGYQFEHNMSDDVTFRQNARFSHVDVNLQLLLGNGYDGPAANAALSRFNDFASDISNQAELDSQLEYRFATGPISHTTLFGLDLKHYTLDDDQAFEFGTPDLNLLNPVYNFAPAFPNDTFQNQSLSQNALGLYAQDQMKLGRLTLVLSGRNDWVNTGDNNHLPGGLSASRDDTKFSGRAGLIYNTDAGVAPYVSYATSFNPLVGTINTGQLFVPETGQQAEVGVKFTPAGFDGHFGAALFDLKRQNVPTTDPNSILLQIQSGEWTSRGIELEMEANLMPGLKMVGSFTKFDLFVSKDPDPTVIGTVPTNTPTELASLWADYTIQSGQLAGLGFGGGVRYNGPSYADAANTLEVPAYTVGDAAIHYEIKNWRYAINVTNIADKTFVASCQTATACLYGDRRRAVASVSYKW